MTSSSAAHPVVAPMTGSTVARRLVGGAVALGAAAPLLMAAWMTPAAKGLGTHEQLNLPPCGWIALMDLPCPTCGMTTAFAHAADGNVVASAVTQPMGAVLAVGAAMAVLIGSYVAATGSRVGSVLARLWGRRTAWALVGFALAAWMYKMVSYKLSTEGL